MDVVDLIETFGTGGNSGAYTVTRRVAATLVHGIAVSGSTSSVPIEAAVFPASARDLRRLPEGRQAQETRVLFTTTKLLVGGQNQPNEADLVNVDGALWEVQLVDFFDSNQADEPYYRCIVQAAYPQAAG